MIRTRGMSADDGRVTRFLLQGVFPAVLIAAIAAFGILELVSSAKPAEPVLSPADTARQVFVVLVAAGFASMAVIQVAKSLLGLRGLWFGGRRGFDGYFGYRWRNYVRSTAMWLSGLFGIAIVEASRVTGPDRGLDILAALLVGGFFSWFARDITASIERLRG